MKRITGRTLTTAVTAAAMCLVGTPALADDGSSTVEQTADLIARAAPDQGAVVPGDLDGDDVVADTGTTTVLVPGDPSDPVVIDSNDDASAESVPLVVTLPAELELADAQVAADGTVVYPGGRGASAAVQVLDDGAARLQTVVPDEHGPTTFTYTFGDGITPVESEDGQIVLVTHVDGAVLGVGTVGEAWAVGADGATVPTWYEITDDALVQHVGVDGSTSFPVVADPLLTYGFGVYMNLTGVQWQVVAAAVTGATVGVATAACLGAKLPAGWAKAIGAGCTLIGVSTGISAFLSAIRSVTRMNVVGTACYQVKLGSASALTRVAAKNCA